MAEIIEQQDSSNEGDHKIFLAEQAIEKFPFGVIFSKTAPKDILAVNYDTDFCYKYFSTGLEKICGLKRNLMCDGVTNAKRDFPDYLQYFNDDIEVIKVYKDGKVKAFCEPWSPPGVIGPIHRNFVFNMKTSFRSGEDSYMVGCFDLLDDLILREVTYKEMNEVTPSVLDKKPSPQWFFDAFISLSYGFVILDASDNIILANNKWIESGIVTPKNTLTSFESTRVDVIDDYDLGQYYIQDDNSNFYRVCIQRPQMSKVAHPYYRYSGEQAELVPNPSAI